MKILIVEDEEVLNRSMVEYLSSQQYICEASFDYNTALEKLELYDYDCIVLDIMLPGGSGLELLRSLKEQNKLDGVIIVSARNELDDKIEGFKLGADDYLTKPFHLSELGMRISAIIRRKSQQGNNFISFEEITVDMLAKTVKANDTLIPLTRKEYDLLIYFIINKNRILSKSTIAEHLWGDYMDMADNYDFIYAHIKNLRKKLLQAGVHDYIRSFYGMGYKFTT